MARDGFLGGSALFEGLTDEQLEVVAARMRPRQFAPGEQLCAAGDASDRIWLITGGLVIWTAGTTAGGGEIELRMRKGDVIGAQDAITGTERTATVSASTITDTLELDAHDLLELASQFPQILINVIQTQRERLFRASARSAALFSASVRSSSTRGEEIGVIAGPSLKGVIGGLVAAARTASPRPVTVVDRSLSLAGALTASDQLAERERHRADPERVRPRHRRRPARPGRPRRRAGRQRRGGRAPRKGRRGVRGPPARDRARVRRGTSGQPDVASGRI